jgi:hypothetical protein
VSSELSSSAGTSSVFTPSSDVLAAAWSSGIDSDAAGSAISSVDAASSTTTASSGAAWTSADSPITTC